MHNNYIHHAINSSSGYPTWVIGTGEHNCSDAGQVNIKQEFPWNGQADEDPELILDCLGRLITLLS